MLATASRWIFKLNRFQGITNITPIEQEACKYICNVRKCCVSISLVSLYFSVHFLNYFFIDDLVEMEPNEFSM